MLCSLVHNIAACSLDRLPAVQCREGITKKCRPYSGVAIYNLGGGLSLAILDICSATLNFEKWTKGGIVYVTLPLMLQLRNDKRGEVCMV